MRPPEVATPGRRQPGAGPVELGRPPLAHLVGCPLGELGAGRVEREHAIGEGEDGVESMLHDDDRALPARDELAEAGEDRRHPGRVEVRRGLVEDDDPRLGRERPGDREALLLPAGERRGAALLEAGEAREGQRLRDPPPHPLERPPAVLQAERHLVRHAAEDDARRRVLEDHPDAVAEDRGGRGGDVEPVHHERAGERPRDRVGHEAGDREGEGALAGPGRPEDQQRPPAREDEGDVADRRRVAPAVRPAESGGGDRGPRAGGRGDGVVRRGAPGCRIDVGDGHAPDGNARRTPVRESARTSAHPPAPATTAPEMSIAMTTGT